MNLPHKPDRTLYFDLDNPTEIVVIDQRFLPHQLKYEVLNTVEQVCEAIKNMVVRGAPLISITAAYGLYFATLEALHKNKGFEFVERSGIALKKTRPTAVNLSAVIDYCMAVLRQDTSFERVVERSRQLALALTEADLKTNHAIGEHGLKILESVYRKKGKVNVLTHCNAGWLGCIGWGTATAPIYLAHQSKIPIHVWVEETRPRNQGANLTAWELNQVGVDYTVIVDNAGGLVMQKGMVDLVLVGADRVTRNGDTANKIGTYLKALSAYDNHIPFYVALPSTTIDWDLTDGVQNIEIEVRSENEVLFATGLYHESVVDVRLTPASAKAFNPGFDVTPSKYITGFITERGICEASEKGLISLFPEKSKTILNI